MEFILSRMVGIFFGVFIVGIICCYSVVGVVFYRHDVSVYFLAIVVILFVILSYIFIVCIFYKYNNIVEEKYNDELLIQEYKAKADYYKEQERKIQQVHKLRHDLKNQILGLQNGIEFKDKKVQEEWEALLGEVDKIEEMEYAANRALNALMGVKISEALNSNIRIEHKIMVPSKEMKLDYREIGILFGNLMDNSIEACLKLDEKKRWINIGIKCIENCLLVNISNSKSEKDSYSGKTTKKYKERHGIGLRSVQNIVNKYNGVIQVLDKENCFEVHIMLYDVINRVVV